MTLQSIALTRTQSTREWDQREREYLVEAEFSRYIFNTTLIINNINQQDYGEYACVSKNRLGTEKIFYNIGTKGQFGRFGPDGELEVESGHIPDLQSYEDLCPPKDECPTCIEPK